MSGVVFEMSVGARGEERNPMQVKCDECRHVWTAAYLPMDMHLLAKMLKGLRCPNCGAPSARIKLAASLEAPTPPQEPGDE